MLFDNSSAERHFESGYAVAVVLFDSAEVIGLESFLAVERNLAPMEKPVQYAAQARGLAIVEAPARGEKQPRPADCGVAQQHVAAKGLSVQVCDEGVGVFPVTAHRAPIDRRQLRLGTSEVV